MSESFKGESVGVGLAGVVVIDLAEVERVTSYGVREWLSMLAAARKVERWVLARCSEAVVNQLSMIRKFSGNGLVASFYAPYSCGRCGNGFERLFDIEGDAVSIAQGLPPTCVCPLCGGEGRFDDDASTYFAFASSHLGTALPAGVRGVLQELERQPVSTRREVVDKVVDGEVTRLCVQAPLSAELRWPRILEGVEGRLVVDLGGCATADPSGIAALMHALSTLGPEVEAIGLARCPQAVVEAIASTPMSARVRIESAVLDANCASCNVLRPTLVSVDEHGQAIRAGRQPSLACKRCGGPVTLRLPALLQALVGVSTLVQGGAEESVASHRPGSLMPEGSGAPSLSMAVLVAGGL
ncbi:MAG: hypothetical protein HOO96_10070, partial [Polyangiaceae bacterium]|nr:hypothetical protein [Polyangiaceae bacterium]